MNREIILAQLRKLKSEGDAIVKAAESESRAVTAEESERLTELTGEISEARSTLERFDQQRAFASGSASLDRMPDPIAAADPASAAPLVEDRAKYDAWPVEEADQWFRAVRSFGQTKQLPNDMHEQLAGTFLGELRAPTGHNTIVDSEGGFLVPATISNTVLLKSHGEGTLISRFQSVPITVGSTTTWNAVRETSRASGSRYGGISVTRVGEASTLSGTTTEFEQIKLGVKKLGALVYFTDEQLEDGPQAMTVINDLLPKAIQFKIEDEAITGDGVTQMEGILNAACTVSVAKETGQSAATVLYENIIKMWARMHAGSRANAVWLINQDIEPQLFTMSLAVGTGGVPVYMPAGGASASPYGSLFGRPVVPIEHCKTLGTVGDIILADLSQYLYATKGGIKTAQSIHVKFTTSETVMRATLRNDGKPWWKAALTPVNGTNTLSPFVTLATRA